MSEHYYTLKIPKDRVAVLIGKDGETKKDLEEYTRTDLEIDSNEGEVTVSGEDPINLYTVREIIKAIGRGFNPDIAKTLLKQDNVYESLSIKDYVKNNNHIPRLKGRVIGKDGRSREIIEELSEVNVSVYGKTVGIIGLAENVDIARRAIDSLLSGSPHSSVYKWLEKKRREFKREEMENQLGTQNI
ncbi:MAG: KH domain-containing protein [Nanobdellota archaeon]